MPRGSMACRIRLEQRVGGSRAPSDEPFPTHAPDPVMVRNRPAGGECRFHRGAPDPEVEFLEIFRPIGAAGESEVDVRAGAIAV